MNSAIQLAPKSLISFTPVIPLVARIDIAKIKPSKPGIPDIVSPNHRHPVSPAYSGKRAIVVLLKNSFLSSEVRKYALCGFWSDEISKPPRFIGARIAAATSQIKIPPIHATRARQRCTVADILSGSKTTIPVVVKAETISK